MEMILVLRITDEGKPENQSKTCPGKGRKKTIILKEKNCHEETF